MKEDVVRKAFLDLGYSPRPNQISAVTDIVVAFALGKRHVFLDAPTGSGKSLIALAAQRVLNSSTVIVTATNSLCDQYARDHDWLPQVLGANNYSCPLRKKLELANDNAEFCYKKSRFYYDRFELEPGECGECQFAASRRAKKISPITVTNYSYYIIDQLYIKQKTEDGCYNADMAIFDESHLINEQFAQHYAIFYSAARSREFLNDIRSLCGEASNMELAYSSVFKIIDENVSRGTIGKSNFKKFTDMLLKFYLKMIDIIDNKKIYAESDSSYDRLFAMKRKYHGMFCKIDDLNKFGYEVVVDVKKNEKSLTITPVFVGATSEHMFREKNLFMSATTNYEFMIKTLALDPNDCQLVKVPYSFNRDDKTLDFSFAARKVNWSNMNDPDTIRSLCRDVENVSKRHLGENGVVITTSFKTAADIASGVSVEHDVILHDSKTSAKDVISKFKKSTRPTILVSPSLFEGVDFSGDASKFQVLVKAPYPSLGSKRMFHISRKHRAVYLQMAVMRMNQALGRSTRDVNDKSVTYVLDTNCGKLFRSKYNDWKNQFNLIVE